MGSASSSRSVLVAALALLGFSSGAQAKVFHSRAEALEVTFPDADRVESKVFVLDAEQVERVEALANAPLDTKLVKFYTGFRGEEVVGYAYVDIHTVRTLPEALMIVLGPRGSVRSLSVLAFHEPLDYLPTQRWYRQFDGRSLDASLRLGGEIHGISGATLSARATTLGVRRALALYEVLLREGR
ncbi:MAG: FMN-binding protein [Myxococcota bacterium]